MVSQFSQLKLYIFKLKENNTRIQSYLIKWKSKIWKNVDKIQNWKLNFWVSIQQQKIIKPPELKLKLSFAK